METEFSHGFVSFYINPASCAVLYVLKLQINNKNCIDGKYN
jgi:hypothetical protein